MARLTNYTKEDLLNSSVSYIKKYGMTNFNIRDLAKYVGCSTQPFFKNFSNLDEFKKELKVYLHKDYEVFISKYVDKEHYLYTISYAYALYAMEESNCFYSLFITDLAGSRTVREVLDTERNVPTIEALMVEYKLSRKKAEEIYRDVRFYTHGIATQLCIKSISMDKKELSTLIKNNIELNIRGK